MSLLGPTAYFGQTHFIVAVFVIGFSSVSLAADLPVGKSAPDGQSEVSVVGRSTRENAIRLGSGAYNALDVSLNPKISHGRVGASESEVAQTRRMLYELRMKLDDLSAKCQALTPPLSIRVIEGWVPPDRAGSADVGAIHSEGRAIDITVLDAAGNPDAGSLKIVGGIASDASGGSALFDWVSHIDKKVDGAGVEVAPAYLHLSIKMPTLKTLVNSGVRIGDDASLDPEAAVHLRTIMAPTDATTLDSFIRKYRDTPSGKAALAIRYSTLRERGKKFLAYADDGQKKLANYDESTTPKRSELEQQAIVIANDYNDFISAHPATVASYAASVELLQIRRFQDDSLGYLDYISRYPNLAEVQLAIDSLYLLEAKNTLAVKKVEDVPNLADTAAIEALRLRVLAVDVVIPQSWAWRADVSACDAFLRSYPASTQWSTISAYATSLSIEIEGKLQATVLIDSATRVERSRILLGNAVNLYQRLRRLRRPIPPTGSVDDDKYVVETYTDVGRARFLLDQINRIEQVLGAHYRNSDAYRELFELQLRWETNDNIRRISRQLSSIQSTLESSHRQLISELQVQFEQTRKEIRKGFSDVTSELDAMRENLDRNFASVVGGLKILHEDMIVANTQLAEVVTNTREANQSLRAINTQLTRTNEKLDEVVNGQARVKESLDKIDKHVSVGLAGIASEIKSIDSNGPSVTFGFGFPFLGPTVTVGGGAVVDTCNDVCDAAADAFGW